MFDWINGLLADAQTTLRTFVILASIVVFLVIAISTRFAIGKTIITGLIAGFVIWLAASGGLNWISDRVGDEAALPAPTRIELVEGA
jgi:hypothetical protein